ncbi:hypothetical protein D3C86_2132130 [compost metagenome]
MMKSMVGERIWALKSINPEAFQRELGSYFERGYPGFTVVDDDYPYIFLMDNRPTIK